MGVGLPPEAILKVKDVLLDDQAPVLGVPRERFPVDGGHYPEPIVQDA